MDCHFANTDGRKSEEFKARIDLAQIEGLKELNNKEIVIMFDTCVGLVVALLRVNK